MYGRNALEIYAENNFALLLSDIGVGDIVGKMWYGTGHEESKEKIVNLQEEINNHVDIAKDLDIEINKLKDEFKIINENNSKVGEELSKIEGEYKNVQEQSRQEKESKEKIKKEKEMQRVKEEEMNNKQNEEKYNIGLSFISYLIFFH